MNKTILSIFGFTILLALSVLIFFLQRNSSNLPSNIILKHQATIDRVDTLIVEQNLEGGMTSKSKNFNLDLYVKIIKIGIAPYIKQNDTFSSELQFLIQDLEKLQIVT